GVEERVAQRQPRCTQERHISGNVVSDERRITDIACQIRERRISIRRSAQHAIVDTGEVANTLWDGFVRLNEALEWLPIKGIADKSNRADLNDRVFPHFGSDHLQVNS